MRLVKADRTSIASTYLEGILSALRLRNVVSQCRASICLTFPAESCSADIWAVIPMSNLKSPVYNTLPSSPSIRSIAEPGQCPAVIAVRVTSIGCKTQKRYYIIRLSWRVPCWPKIKSKLWLDVTNYFCGSIQIFSLGSISLHNTAYAVWAKY